MASYQVPGADGCTSWKTATDLSSSQYMAVKMSAAKTVAIGDANGDLGVGILQNKPTSGEAAQVFTQCGGICKVYAGAAITYGAVLTPNASGHMITTTTDTDIVFGYATESAGAAGDIIEMLFVGPYAGSDLSWYSAGS